VSVLASWLGELMRLNSQPEQEVYLGSNAERRI